MNENLQINIRSHFLDSGAFSLRRKLHQFQKKNGGSASNYYNSKEFWGYVDSYAAFIKKYKIAIDMYANIDVIGNPKLTWRNQKYLEEKHQLNPIPIVHYQTEMKWLKRYIKKEYKIIGLGGLVRQATKKECREWLDLCFEIICPAPNYLPIVKIHGFGMTKVGFLFRYPWWSVDATTVEQMSRWGKILVPRKVKGKYNYKQNYITIAMSSRVKSHKMTMHTHYLRPKEKEIIKEWLEYINKSGFYKRHLEFETDNNTEYKMANYFYYMKVLDTVPNYPSLFKLTQRKRLL